MNCTITPTQKVFEVKKLFKKAGNKVQIDYRYRQVLCCWVQRSLKYISDQYLHYTKKCIMHARQKMHYY